MSKKRSTSSNDKNKQRVFVIGSGFGGIAVALRLQAKGYQVEIFEKLDQPGGRARVFKQDGFTFDGGPTVITAPFMFEQLWQLAGKSMQEDVDLRPIDPFYNIRLADGQWFHYNGDAQQMRQQVERLAPKDVAGYEKFVQHSQRIYEVGFEKLAHRSFFSFWDMLRIVPEMLRLQSFRSVYQLAAHYIEDERLRQVFSFHPLLVGGDPFRTTSIYSLILYLERSFGVHFPMGGTGSLLNGLIKLFQNMGGKLHLNSPVKTIEVDEKGQVKGLLLEQGDLLPCSTIISNGDVAWTYENLLSAVSKKYWNDKRLSRSRYSMSLFVWYFGTNCRYEDVAHHSILLGPRYRSLLQDIFRKHHLADDFSLYLHRPTATDPSLAPEGCDAFYVLSPVPHLASGTNWQEEAEAYRRKIAAYLEKDVLKDLQRHIVTSKILTPLHFKEELWSYRGAAFGMEPLLTQSAYFRPHNQSESIGGLYFVGAGTHPGAGLPGVLSSAKVVDNLFPALH